MDGSKPIYESSCQEYIANCIWRIFKADCCPAKEWERCQRIAKIAYDTALLEESSDKALHERLADLVELAEGGEFN